MAGPTLAHTRCNHAQRAHRRFFPNREVDYKPAEASQYATQLEGAATALESFTIYRRKSCSLTPPILSP